MAPERLEKWIAGFGERHGGLTEIGSGGGALVLTASDGAVASLLAPPGTPAAAEADVNAFVALAVAHRQIGLLLARKSAVAVGVAVGPALTVSKVDSHYVQGRTAAGGWSQQRFARRRDNQAKAAAGGAADLAVRLLLPAAGTLDALVTGGDRRTVDTILADRRLAPLAPLVSARFLAVAEPRHAVLEAAVAQAREVRIGIVDPPA